MDFNVPTEVLTQCTQMLLGQQTVMRNRAMVNRLFNGEAPASEEERRAENIKTNVNFLEATRLAANAKEQLSNAFAKGDRYFTVRCNYGPAATRKTISEQITQAINRELKKSRAYRSARKSAFAQVVLHGPGPLAWRNRRVCIPGETGVDDVLLPTGTLASMDNLDRFALYREYTWTQLQEQTQGAVVDPGWNRQFVTALLVSLYKRGVEPVFQGNRWMFPEKLAEDVKEGGAFTVSSALPKILAWDFFYRDEDTGKWNRRMVLDFGSVDESVIPASSKLRANQSFIYEKDGYADDWQEIIHFYVGNCSNVAPFRYNSIRSIGYLLYGVCMIQNKLRNRMNDHMFQALLTWFRNVSDDNREKVQMIDLQNYGIFPDGVSMVNAQERYAVDWNLINMGLAQGRQLMAESTQGFLPDALTEGSSSKEMTASEWVGRMNMSIALTSAVSSDLAVQAEDEYREICRRFCIKGNPDPMAVRFREEMRKQEVGEKYLDVEHWEVLPEHTAGGGNKAAELMISQAAMQELMPFTDEQGQRVLLRRRALALTDNADEALLLFPDAPKPPSDDVQYAQGAFAVLMLGVPFMVQEGVNHVAYTAMLMQMAQVVLGQVVAAVQQPNGTAIAADKIVGLFNVFQHCQEQINVIARARSQEQQAKALVKALAEMSGQLQQAAKQLMAAEQEQQGGGIDPKTLAKVQEIQMQGEMNRQQRAADAEQKREQKQIQWAEENERRNATTAAEAQRKQVLTAVEVQALDLKTAAEIARPKGGK